MKHINRFDIHYIQGVVSLKYKQLYRVRHDLELGGVRQVVTERGVPLPEVYPLFPNQFTKLGRDWQFLWKGINPQLSPLDWRKLLTNERFATNGNGFGDPEDPRVDFVNGLNIGADEPKIEALFCGGACVTGVETVYRGELALQVNVLNGNDPVPTVDWMWAHPEYMFEAVSVRPDGRVQSFSLTPFAELVPLIAQDLPVYYPLEFLEKLPLGSPRPSPYF